MSALQIAYIVHYAYVNHEFRNSLIARKNERSYFYGT